MEESLTMRYWLSPKGYFRLLYRSLFKAISLAQEVENWPKNRRLAVMLQAGAYNYILALGLVLIVQLLFFPSFSFEQDFGKLALRVALGVAFGVAFGVVGEMVFGVVAGVAAGVAGGVSGGVTLGVALGMATGVGIGLSGRVASGVYVGLAPAVVFGVVGGLAGDVTFGGVFTISYFLILGRYFYWPFYYFRYSSTSPRNPLRWDENIALPIPFFNTLLRRYTEKEGLEAAAAFATFLLENRPVQRKVAQSGLLTLAADAMKRFSSPRQIANLRQELSFMPNAEQMPEDYGEALRPLLELSEDTQKALREYNPANQLRLLKGISRRLAEFQKTANLSRQRSWAAFGQVSLQWKRVIDKEVHRIGQSAGLPLPNPFITGNPIREKDSPLFVGRRDIINQIQTEALREGAAGAILFTGNRRTGKTSTLLHLERFLPSTLRPAFFDCQSPFLQSSLASFSTAVGQRVMQRCGLEKEAPPTGLAALTTLLEKAQQQLAAQNHYLLICIDEYERLGPLIANGTLPGLADTFRYWIQHFPRLILLFAGSHELAEARAIDWTDYLINVRTVRISYLEEEAALQLATQPIPDFGLRYESEALPLAFVRRLGRQPYLLQCALYELVEHLNNDGNRRTATAADLEVAIQQMFVAATNHFEHFWRSELDERGREVVRRLSQGLPVPEEEPAVKRLVRKEVLRREEGRLVFCVLAVGEWVQENY